MNVSRWRNVVLSRNKQPSQDIDMEGCLRDEAEAEKAKAQARSGLNILPFIHRGNERESFDITTSTTRWYLRVVIAYPSSSSHRIYSYLYLTGPDLSPPRKMRLLHTTTVKLSSFDDDNLIPPFAILSHTWSDDEISFHDLLKYPESELNESKGYQNIRSCCALAAAERHEYVWIDTCCIDKTSSAELSEAINSMYRWFQEAQICYAYLADIDIDDIRDDDPWEIMVVELLMGKSRWLTRVGTLLELLATGVVVFYDRYWRGLGSKSSLINQISRITGIQPDHIHDINGASVAQKMSWASKRQTTRVEDMAYSLMGIFDVNMPLLYGEGKKAFTRLQHEIVKISNDESLFAWKDDGLLESGLFAQSPKAFTESGEVVRISSDHRGYIHRAPYTVTNRGLAIEALASCDSRSTSILDQRFAILPLNCRQQRPSDSTLHTPSESILPEQITIMLEKVSRDEFVRFSPWQLHRPWQRIRTSNVAPVGLAYIRPEFIPYDSRGPRLSLFIDSTSLAKRGVKIVDTYNCRPEIQWGVWSNETLMRITFGCGESFAALLLQTFLSSSSSLQSFIIMIRAAESSLSISLIVPSSRSGFHKEMDQHQRGQKCHYPADPVPIKLQDNRWVSMALREKQVGDDRRHYLAEFVPTGEDDILKPKNSGWWWASEWWASNRVEYDSIYDSDT